VESFWLKWWATVPDGTTRRGGRRLCARERRHGAAELIAQGSVRDFWRRPSPRASGRTLGLFNARRTRTTGTDPGIQAPRSGDTTRFTPMTPHQRPGSPDR